MASKDSPTAWYGAMTSLERKTFWATFGGWTLNSLDFFLFTFAIPAIVVTYDLTRLEALRIGSVTLAASAIGGWIAGAAADRFGRVRVLQFTIVWFAVFALLCSLVQGYWQLLICRGLMGFGLGGEWAVGAVLLAEMVRNKDRGKALGAMQSGWAVGWAIAAIVAIAILIKVRPDLSWRVLMALGILPALLIFFIRRHLVDAPVFVETQKNFKKSKRFADYREIFSPSVIKSTFLTTLLAAGAHGGYLTSAWLLEFLRDNRRIAEMGSGRYIAAIIGGAFIGYLISAYLNDRLGRRPTFFLFGIGAAVSVYVIVWLAANDHGIVFWGFMLSMFASGTFSGIGSTFSEHFPTHLRGSGVSFSYNAGRLLAAGIPGLLAALSTSASFNRIIDFIAIAAYGLVIIAAWYLSETKGKVLRPSR